MVFHSCYGVRKFALISLLISFFILFSSNKDVYSQNIDSLDLAYNYYNSGQVKEAIDIFENYIKGNPKDTKIYLQLGYAYSNLKDFDKAFYYFQYVEYNSSDNEEIDKAKNQIYYINKDRKNQNVTEQSVIKDTTILTNNKSELDLAYKYLNEGYIESAIPLFENYVKLNPDASQINLQLAYIYFKKKDYVKALIKFESVASKSKNEDEISSSKEAIIVLNQMISTNSNTTLELYFYNVYDSFQQNYISNLLSHLNFKIAKNFSTGVYLDLYLDSRSKPDLIYNDRYVEFGGFWRVSFLKYLSFELRTGYVREIDLKKNSFNVKPILTFGMRIGDAKFYSDNNDVKKESIFMDIYSAGLYDYKFRNFFGQIYLRETMRFLTGGFSFIDFYLGQNILGDTKQLDYNNYGEISAGIGFKPSIINFPVLFVEVSNKFYWVGSATRNSFQVKAGFLLNFNIPL